MELPSWFGHLYPGNGGPSMNQYSKNGKNHGSKHGSGVFCLPNENTSRNRDPQSDDSTWYFLEIYPIPHRSP